MNSVEGLLSGVDGVQDLKKGASHRKVEVDSRRDQTTRRPQSRAVPGADPGTSPDRDMITINRRFAARKVRASRDIW